MKNSLWVLQKKKEKDGKKDEMKNGDILKRERFKKRNFEVRQEEKP